MPEAERPRRGAFSLTELMIALAIVSALIALALPSFARLRYRALTAEAKLNLGALRSLERVYYGEFGRYAAAAATPPGRPGPSPRAFTGGGASDFARLGFVPEGELFFQYAVAVDPLHPLAYAADAQADLDGDRRPQLWGYRHPDPSGYRSPYGGPLGCLRVIAGLEQDAQDTVGPCAEAGGIVVFGVRASPFEVVDPSRPPSSPYGESIF